jgi:hypothetical protein
MRTAPQRTATLPCGPNTHRDSEFSDATRRFRVARFTLGGGPKPSFGRRARRTVVGRDVDRQRLGRKQDTPSDSAVW